MTQQIKQLQQKKTKLTKELLSIIKRIYSLNYQICKLSAKLILILLATATTSFAGFSAHQFTNEEVETGQKADKWATEYLKNFLDTIGPMNANAMSGLLIGAVIVAQENLEKVARHLVDDPDYQAQFIEDATSSLKIYIKELEGIFFAYPNQKQAFNKAKEYLNEE